VSEEMEGNKKKSFDPKTSQEMQQAHKTETKHGHKTAAIKKRLMTVVFSFDFSIKTHRNILINFWIKLWCCRAFQSNFRYFKNRQ